MRAIAVLPAADFPAITRARTELLQNITTPPLTSNRYAGLPFKAAHGAELRNGEFGGIHKIMWDPASLSSDFFPVVLQCASK